mmetsp:Transcript_785/g.1233  ORF Transcript_785/g.1233 Transcript_785/m.1233 type:complete len:246 (-) Transcript_785:1783-2520(-)
MTLLLRRRSFAVFQAIAMSVDRAGNGLLPVDELPPNATKLTLDQLREHFTQRKRQRHQQAEFVLNNMEPLDLAVYRMSHWVRTHTCTDRLAGSYLSKVLFPYDGDVPILACSILSSILQSALIEDIRGALRREDSANKAKEALLEWRNAIEVLILSRILDGGNGDELQTMDTRALQLAPTRSTNTFSTTSTTSTPHATRSNTLRTQTRATTTARAPRRATAVVPARVNGVALSLRESVLHCLSQI